MKILTSKAYALEYGGLVFNHITTMELERDGFTYLGYFEKEGKSPTVREVVESKVSGKPYNLVVYQSLTRQLGKHKIWIYVR